MISLLLELPKTVCMWVYVSVWVCVSVWVYAWLSKLCVSMCVCVYLCIRVCMYACVYVCLSVSWFLSLGVCICVSFYVCVSFSVFVYVCLLCTWAFWTATNDPTSASSDAFGNINWKESCVGSQHNQNLSVLCVLFNGVQEGTPLFIIILSYSLLICFVVLAIW